MPEQTTAVALGRFYQELLDEGVPPDLATDIVRDAAKTVVMNEGIGVKA